MIPYNFHMHTHYSDGSSAPEKYITEALLQGFKGIGFSEHSVLPFKNTFALQSGREASYLKEIADLKLKHASEIEIYTALEADYIPNSSEDFLSLKQSLNLDYIIGSVHLVINGTLQDNLWFIDGPKAEIYDDGINSVFNGDAKKAVTAYWHQVNKMVENERFDIVGHLDKIKMHNKNRYFLESDKWYQDLVKETVSLIAEKDLMVEINTRGLYKKRSDSLFPGDNIIRVLKEKSIKTVLNSDAHQPGEISLYFNEAVEILKQSGYKCTYVYSDNQWVEFPL